MSSPLAIRSLDVPRSERLHGRDERDAAGGPRPYRPLTALETGRGRLGLEDGHREVADLIRRSEVLAVSGDQSALQDSARRVVETLQHHIDSERPRFARVDRAQRRRLLAGQEAVLDYATRFAGHPTPDLGADLLALLVRQADFEEAAVHAGVERQPADRGQPEFTTDWAIA